MKQICISCDGKMKNTGVSGQDVVFGLDSALIYVPLNAADGTANHLDLTAPDMDAELLGKLNHPDPTKRWYLIKDAINVTAEQAEAVYETTPTDERYKLRDGIQPYNYELWGMSRTYFNQLRTQCVDFGIIRIDDCGNMLGEVSEDGEKFYPREVNKRSYSARYISATADGSPKVMVTFDFDRHTNEGNQALLSFQSFSYNVLRMSGMLEATLEVVSVDTATELTIKVELIYGAINAKVPVEGLDIADFDLVEVATGTSIAPLVGVADGANPGEYKITTPATTTGDEYRLSVFKAATNEREQGVETNVVTYTSL